MVNNKKYMYLVWLGYVEFGWIVFKLSSLSDEYYKNFTRNTGLYFLILNREGETSGNFQMWLGKVMDYYLGNWDVCQNWRVFLNY